MSTREWPETLCSTEMYRKHLIQPFRVDDWTVCSDGKLVVGVKGGGEDVGSTTESVEDAVREHFAREPAAPVTFDMDALREWCGPAENECPDCTPEDRGNVCSECKGLGYVECECSDCWDLHDRECPECNGASSMRCSTCDDDGTVSRYTIDRRGVFGGVPLNKRLLAAMLDGAPGETVTMSPPEKPNLPFVLVGDGWRGVLMPLRTDDGNPCDPLDGLALEVAS